MTTRMVHPRHGATHAYGDSDIARLKTLGWAVEGEKAGAAHVALVKSAIAAEIAEPEKRRPGRPPKAK